jgi:hypothetical protein
MSGIDEKIEIRTEEAKQILQEIGMAKEQQNERSAWSLLALLNITPEKHWSDAECISIGITPIMEFIGKYYRSTPYKPNTRETIRRQTMHQFVEAGIAVENPDNPERPINSPDWRYQISAQALQLFRTYKSSQWKRQLKIFLSKNQSLTEEFVKHRGQSKLKLCLGNNTLKLTSGKHSQLTIDVIEKFRSYFAAESDILYLGDTGNKLLHYDRQMFESLEITLNPHGNFPDIILYDRKKKWLLLIEVVTSHGHVNSQRHKALSKIVKNSTVGLVFITAFPDKTTMKKYVGDITGKQKFGLQIFLNI